MLGARSNSNPRSPHRAGFTADIANCPVNLCLPESSFSSHFQHISHPLQSPQGPLSNGCLWERSQK